MRGRPCFPRPATRSAPTAPARAGARGVRPGLPGRASRPGEPAGRREGVDAADARALAAGPGSARPHRRDPVACRGRRRRIPAHLHAVPGRRHALGRAGSSPADPPLPRDRGNLLSDLDAVAAPESWGVNPAHPARELLGSLTDDRAMAWITARLAEALDHAFNRDVAHGDVKPSNILLTADGTPMLLDFNLAQDGSLAIRRPLEDLGGTLAYMAPERLRAIASGVGPAASPRVGDSAGREATATRRHGPRSAPSRPVRTGDGLAGGTHRGLPSPAGPGLRPARTPGPAWRRTLPNSRRATPPFASAEPTVVHPLGRVSAGSADPPRPSCDPRTLPGGPARGPLRPRPRAGRRPRPLAGRPAAGLCRRAVLGPDLAPPCPREENAALRPRPSRRRRAWSRHPCVMNASRSTLQHLALHKLARIWDDIESHAFQFQRPGSPQAPEPRLPGGPRRRRPRPEGL